MKIIIYKFLILSGLAGILLVSYLARPAAEIQQLPGKKIINTKEDAYVIKAVDKIKSEHRRKNSKVNKIPTDIIEYVSESERIDFQCEKQPEKKDEKPVYGYEYSLIDSSRGIYDIRDNSKYGNNEIVKYCRSNKDNAQDAEGVILSGLIKIGEKRENEFAIWNPDGFDIYVLPRIRIDSAFAASVYYNMNYPVCLITITNGYGDILVSMNLLVRDFYNEADLKYDGEYKEEYESRPGGEILIIRPDTLKSPARMHKNRNKKTEYVNIEIFYYGYCDMWIDYIRVENQPANELLTKRDASLINRLKKEMGNQLTEDQN